MALSTTNGVINMFFIEKINTVVDPILKKIIQHPFLEELSDGTLEKSIYHAYLEQDYYYLLDYSAALLKLSLHEIPVGDKLFLHECAESCTKEPAFEIKNLITNHQARRTSANIDYINYINNHVSSNNYQNGLASVFPCFYIYYRVGKELTQKNDKYAAWFNIYASDSFVKQVETIIPMLEKEYDLVDENQKKCMLEIIEQGSIHEFNFWDAVYPAISAEPPLCCR